MKKAAGLWDMSYLTPVNKARARNLIKMDDVRIPEIREKVQDHNNTIRRMKTARAAHGWRDEIFNKVASGFIETLVWCKEQPGTTDPRALRFNIIVPCTKTERELLEGLPFRPEDQATLIDSVTKEPRPALEISLHMEDVARFLTMTMRYYKGRDVVGDVWEIGSVAL